MKYTNVYAQLAIGLFLLCLVSTAVAETALGCWDGSSGAVSRYTFDNADRNGGTITTNDVCLRHNLIESGTIGFGQTGMFGESYGFNNAGKIITNTFIRTASTPIAVSFWTQGNSSAGYHTAFMLGTAHNSHSLSLEYYTGTTGYEFIGYHDASNRFLHGTTLTANTWYHMLVVYNSSDKVYLYKNGTLTALVADVALGTTTYTDVADNTNFYIGSNTANEYWVGKMDDLRVYNYTSFSDANLTAFNLKTYNNLTGLTGGGGAVTPPTTTTSAPVTNDHDDNFTATFVSTWYASNNTANCSIFANGTNYGTNSSEITNATVYQLTNNALGGNGYYTWYIGCQQNDTTWANSTTLGFYLDTTAPTINIYSPTAASSYYYGDTITLNGTFMDDIGLFNCSQELYAPNGTLVKAYYHVCSGTSYALANQTYLPDWIGAGSANYSATDSHTADKNDIEATIDGEKIKFRNKDNNKRFESSNIVVTADTASFIPSYIEGIDRIKFSYTITNKNAQKNWIVDIPFVSECPIYKINGTPYYNHLVTCNSWIDYDDIQTEGWSVNIQYINESAINQHFTKSFPNAEKTVVIDPATGGLNFGSTVTAFTILVDSQLYVNTTSFYQSTTGYISANYSNITTGEVITGAYCRVTITDPFGAATVANLTKTTTYIGNYTPTYLGTYTYSVTCDNNSSWYAQTATGSFIVTGAPPATTYAISPSTSEYESGTACYNASLMAHYKKQYFCTAGGCETVDITNYEMCPYGCEGKTCVRSAFAELNIWWAIAATVFLLFLLYGRSSIGKVAGKFIRW
jgi:hypothetical protein